MQSFFFACLLFQTTTSAVGFCQQPIILDLHESADVIAATQAKLSDHDDVASICNALPQFHADDALIDLEFHRIYYSRQDCEIAFSRDVCPAFLVGGGLTQCVSLGLMTLVGLYLFNDKDHPIKTLKNQESNVPVFFGTPDVGIFLYEWQDQYLVERGH